MDLGHGHLRIVVLATIGEGCVTTPLAHKTPRVPAARGVGQSVGYSSVGSAASSARVLAAVQPGGSTARAIEPAMLAL